MTPYIWSQYARYSTCRGVHYSRRNLNLHAEKVFFTERLVKCLLYQRYLFSFIQLKQYTVVTAIHISNRLIIHVIWQKWVKCSLDSLFFFFFYIYLLLGLTPKPDIWRWVTTIGRVYSINRLKYYLFRSNEKKKIWISYYTAQPFYSATYRVA